MGTNLRNNIKEPRTYELQLRHGSTRQKVGFLNRSPEATTLQIERRQLPQSVTFMSAGTNGDTVEVPDLLVRCEPFLSLIANGALTNIDAPKEPAKDAKSRQLQTTKAAIAPKTKESQSMLKDAGKTAAKAAPAPKNEQPAADAKKAKPTANNEPRKDA